MAKRKMPVLGKREWKHLIKDFATDQAIADHFGVTRQTVFLNRKKVLSGSTDETPVVDQKTPKQEPKPVVDQKAPKQEPKPIKGKKKVVKAAPKAAPEPTALVSDKVIALFKKGKKPKEIAELFGLSGIAELVGLSGSYVYNILTILTKNLGSVKNQ